LERVKRFLIILGVILLVLGVVGLVHPSFSYHKQEEVAKIGSFKATVDEEKTAQVPAAVSIVLLVTGLGLVLLGPRIK
jgi:anionic cell wall polymer biosynthesis LytR-Cps2A-Psr (LCP) family protein